MDKEYTWTVTRKFPFIKKRPLMQVEKIYRDVNRIMVLLPVVPVVVGIARIIQKLKPYD